MNEQLYRYITDKQHHALRRTTGWDPAPDFAARGLDPAERMIERFEHMCREERPVILPGEQIAFTRTVADLPDCFTPAEWEALRREHFIHELGYLSNLSPDYYAVIATGLAARREEADARGRRAIDALLELTDRYADEAARQGLSELAATLRQVPRGPARNFREALQSFRILHFALWLEGNYHNTVGRFDLHIYPYLAADIAAGVQTRESALALVREFFLSFNKDSDLYPGVQQGDNGQSLMLGGCDAEGHDTFNLLSELCLEASRQNRLIDPKINLRVSRRTPPERYTMASRLTEVGLGFPQYSNDDVVIPALERLGYAHEDAVNYTVAACWEFIIPGVGADVANIGALSFPRAVDEALHHDLAGAATFGDFFAAVKARVTAQAAAITEGIRDLWFVPSPFMGVLTRPDIHCGAKYNNFGIHGTGIATAADSLAAIRRYVFEEARLSKEALLKAVDENFENDPVLLHLLRYEAPKVGSDDDYADDLLVSLLDTFADSLEGRVNCRGGRFRAGTGSAMYYLWHANELGASPDGRRRGEPFGANFSVSLFAPVKSPVTVVASMTKPHFDRAINGGPLTLELDQSLFADADGAEKVGQLVRAFIARGGHQLQLNAVDRATLLDAQVNPDAHRHLVVRIWGWSAYFVELDREYQDHVLARQAYAL